MNLRKMIFWNSPSAPSAEAALPMDAALPPRDDISNVIQLPQRNALDAPAGLGAAQEPAISTAALGPEPRGLMDAPELQAFFADNHFGLGRHNGANYKTQDALTLGKQALVSRFQNALAGLAEQKQAKADRLRNTQLQTEGLCNTTTTQLGLACTRLERDMAVLREQIQQAADGKGWVLEALNRYQIGFGKGLREAVDFELIGN